MPTVKGQYAMNPGVARRRAAEAEPDDDDYTSKADAGDQDTDDVMPSGHELDEVTIKPASNGFTVNHRTRLTKAERLRREKAAKNNKGEVSGVGFDGYRGTDKVFESADRAVGHVAKVLKKHAARRG